jgi:superfamily II DNA or RNA helicase
MVDFTKKLANKRVSKVSDPIELYKGLDRASDKGPLRPSQDAILREWNETRRGERDVIVKLHTGQGNDLPPVDVPIKSGSPGSRLLDGYVG